MKKIFVLSLATTILSPPVFAVDINDIYSSYNLDNRQEAPAQQAPAQQAPVQQAEPEGVPENVERNLLAEFNAVGEDINITQLNQILSRVNIAQCDQVLVSFFHLNQAVPPLNLAQPNQAAAPENVAQNLLNAPETPRDQMIVVSTTPPGAPKKLPRGNQSDTASE